ncbi:unnamed protein product, partial [Symbiodinium sp. KB8]
KVATLFFLNKARAAAAAGTGAAVAACIAFGCGVLPDDDGNSWWCLSSGCLAYLLTMLFWRPRQLVFVDRVCISQVNPELQAQGTLSLGAILKCSDTMLVLWDPTWARRLWCVYELAAFIRSRSPGEKPRVIIRPTLLGFTMFACWFACALGGFAFHFANNATGGLALCGLIFWYIAHLVREYCRDVTTMCQQIAHFSVATAESFCCSVEHKHPHSKEPLMCDREVMQRCINIWFGGIEAFEQRVQGDLYNLLVDQLANHMVSYWRLAEASPVFFWFHLDNAARELLHFIHAAEGGESHYLTIGSMQLLLGLSYWLGVVPILFRVMFRLAWAMQTKCACRLLDYTKSLLLLLPGIFIFGAFLYLHAFLSRHFPHDLGSLGVALITIPLAALVWRNLPVPVPRHNVRLPLEPGAHSGKLGASSQASQVREWTEIRTCVSSWFSMPPTVTVLGHPDILGHDLDVDVSVPSERPSSSSDKEAGECLAQTKSSSSSDEEAAQAESIAEFAADIISKLEPVRPDVVRATRVQNVLHRLGRPLRLGKVATLFFLTKAGAATAAGTGVAVAACMALGFGVLPDDDGSSWWCLSSGCLAYLLTMLLWRPRQLVFVDRVCISQVNPELQAQGTLSLGAILKCSDTMLVLWDPTWALRLWCVYELAAFIRSRSPGEKPRVIIRPTLLGFTMFACWFACALGGFAFHFIGNTIGHETIGMDAALFLGLALCGVIFWYIAHLVREYCRDVTT